MPDILSLKKGDYLVWRDKDLDLIQGKIVMSSLKRLADEARAQGWPLGAGRV